MKEGWKEKKELWFSLTFMNRTKDKIICGNITVSAKTNTAALTFFIVIIITIIIIFIIRVVNGVGRGLSNR